MADIPEYAKVMMNRENVILIGIDFCGFKTSSPVVAIASKPVN
jgi:hypothetical protein